MAEETGRRNLKCYEANIMASCAHTVHIQHTAQRKRGTKISLVAISGSSIFMLLLMSQRSNLFIILVQNRHYFKLGSLG